MAYVAITPQLITSVKEALGGMQKAEMSALPDPNLSIKDLANDPEFGAYVVERLWAPLQDVRERLQAYNRNEVFVRFAVVRDDDPGTDVCSVTVRLNGLPGVLRGGDSHYYPHEAGKLRAGDYHSIPALLTAFKDMTDVALRWNAVTEQVANFLISCKSLNEAMKLWPDVQRYIPKKYIERLGAKTERALKEESKALAALRAVDMDAVAASTVLARMAGAQV